MNKENSDNIMMNFFYDCVIAALFRNQQNFPIFLENFFLLQQAKDRKTVEQIKTFFQTDKDGHIRPMWLSRQFILPYIAYITRQRLGLFLKQDTFEFRPTISVAQNLFFQAQLEDVEVHGKMKNNHAFLYLLGAIAILSTTDLIEGRIPLDVIVDEIAYSH